MKQLVLLSCWLISAACSCVMAALPTDDTSAARLAHVLQLAPKKQHTEAPVITAVAVQPGGQRIAAAGDDHVVRLWGTAQSQFVRRLEGHTDWVQTVVFTPDGESLITAGADGRVLKWDLHKPAQPVELHRQEQAIFDMAITPRGDQLFVVGFASQLHVLSLKTRSAPVERPCGCNDMRSIAVSPNGQFVAGGGRSGQVHVWSVPECKCAHHVQPHHRRIRSITFSSDSRWLITAGEDRTIAVTNLGDGREIMRLSSGPAKVLALAVCGDNLLASAGSDNVIRLWDLERATQLGRLEGHSGSVAALASHGQLLVSGSFDTTVRVWKVIEDDELQARRKQASESTVR